MNFSSLNKTQNKDKCINIKQKPKTFILFSHFVESNFQINRRSIELNMYSVQCTPKKKCV